MTRDIAQSPRSVFRHAPGFSLLELLVVMAILALAAAVVPPVFAPALDKLQVSSAAREVAAALRLARNTAVSSGRETVLGVDVDAKRISLNERTRDLTLPKDAVITLTTADAERNSASAGGIRFFPDGSSTGGRVLLEHAARSYRIDVNWITGGVAVAR
ncbi:MAG: GspH/FimT family pseudopilin [Gammaproteobacteria bacterium]|nr:GspH/FimT family pseudopilin [Gammaproteobacteria bacterium]